MKKSRAVVAAPVDELPELIVDRDFKNPQPLDHRIASVWLRTPTNNPTEGYDLLVSASFGQEWVTLKAEGFEFNVNFALTTADIELEFRDCTASLIEETRVAEAKTTIKEHSRSKSKFGVAGGGAVSGGPAGVGGKAFLGARFENTGLSSTIVQRNISRPDYHRTGSNTIQVGPTGDILYGPLVSEYKGWRVQPSQLTSMSAVIARLKVRENWVKFDEVKVVTSPPPFVDRLKDLFSRADRKRREYFKVLLAYLAQSALAKYQDGRAATIAANVLLVRPYEKHAASISSRGARHEIDINGDLLVRYLRSEEGHEASALIGLGVKPEMLRPIAEGGERKSTHGKFFVPDSSPVHALEVLTQIAEWGLVKRGEIMHPPCLHDLRALKLITVNEDGEFVLMNPSRFVDPTFMLQRAVMGMECIEVARTVLMHNPSAGSAEISDAVSLELGKVWEVPATKLRNGNAIKRWTVWLTPYLLNPDSGSDAAAQVAYSRSKRVSKGRPSSFRRARAKELRRLVAEGKTPAEIAEIFNVTRQTIYIWKKRARLK